MSSVNGQAPGQHTGAGLVNNVKGGPRDLLIPKSMADDHGGGQAHLQVQDSSRQLAEIHGAPWGSVLQKKPVVTVPPMVLKDQPSPPNYWSDLAMQIWDVILTVEDKLGDFFGVYDSKYQWAVNDYYLQQLKIAEKRRISQEVDQQKISTMENGMCPAKEQRMEMQSGRGGSNISSQGPQMHSRLR